MQLYKLKIGLKRKLWGLYECKNNHDEFCRNLKKDREKAIIKAKELLAGKEYSLIIEDIVTTTLIKKKNQIKEEFLDKIEVWEEEYKELYTWEWFNANYWWCDNCKDYQEGQCMCYAR